jgi:hypothetical protein
VAPWARLQCSVLNTIHRYQINSANQTQNLQQYSLFSRWLTLGSQVEYAARQHNRNYLSPQVSIACQTSYYIIESLLKIAPQTKTRQDLRRQGTRAQQWKWAVEVSTNVAANNHLDQPGTSQGSCLSRGQPSRRRI